MQDGLVDWETGTCNSISQHCGWDQISHTSSAWEQECHQGLSSCHVESSCLGEGGRGTESGGEGTQSEKSGAFCDKLSWIRQAAWRFRSFIRQLAPVCAQEWRKEGKADYEFGETGRWPKA